MVLSIICNMSSAPPLSARAKNCRDGHERALSETSLRPAPMPANSNEAPAPPRRPKSWTR
jgi:hypothetical protein